MTVATVICRTGETYKNNSLNKRRTNPLSCPGLPPTRPNPHPVNKVGVGCLPGPFARPSIRVPGSQHSSSPSESESHRTSPSRCMMAPALIDICVGFFGGVFGMSARQLCAITKNDNCRNGELARQGMEEGLGKVSCNSDPGTAYPMIPCRLHILQVSLKLEPKVEGVFLIQKRLRFVCDDDWVCEAQRDAI